MSFDLRITLTGMFLFVPDKRAGSIMRLLLPDMTGHPEHPARLLYDRAYIDPGASELQRDLKCINLDRQRLSLAGSSASLAVPSEIVDLGPTGAAVDATLLDATPPAVVKSHIEFGIGAITDYEFGATFDYAGSTQRMAFQVDWTIRGLPAAGGQDRLDWHLISLNDGTTVTPLDSLRPIGDVVHVFLYHTLATELLGQQLPPVVPSPGDEVEHFHAFYQLATGGTVSTGPEFNTTAQPTTDCAALGPAPRREAAIAAALSAASRGGSPFTCMPATAPIR